MPKYLVQHRRGTAEQWAEQGTLIPREGEIVIEIDEVNSLHKLKIGDGVHTYAELAYLQAGDEIVTQVLAEAKPRVVTVELSESWAQDSDDKYYQTLTLDGITNHSRLDLQPDANMLAEFKQLGLVFVTENNSGAITVYSVGNMPQKAYTMQATIVETECDGEDACIIGAPIGTPVAQSNWSQTDNTKADFIKNKPTLGDLAAKDEVAKTDLAADVQASLDKANTAIQSIDGLATEAYVNSAIGAIPTPDVSGQIGTHNTNTSAHNDIRNLITGLTNRLNALADSDDTTLDQMSEIVDYIKSNKSLIEEVTTNKINVADIIDNLTTNVTNKPLSAAQGVALKALIDGLELSDLTADSTHRTVTDDEKAAWNAKSNFSGSYNDLTNKPTIPTKTSELTNDIGFKTTDNNTTYTFTTGDSNGQIKATSSDGTAQNVSVKGLGSAAYTASTDYAPSGHVGDSTHVSATEKAAWNAKSTFSGNYNDLTNKPTIPTRSVVTQPKDQSIVTYFKISNFGTWYGLATNEKVSLLIGTRSGETILFTLAGENATTMGASALRLNDRYSKISGIYYKISENAIYVALGAWANILSVDVLSDKSGNYTPIVEQIDALPTDAADAAVDAKLITVPIVPFGSHYTTGIVVGNTAQNLAFGGKNARPTYNSSEMALKSDVDSLSSEIANKQNKISTENWTFTLEDGTTVTKAVYIG